MAPGLQGVYAIRHLGSGKTYVGSSTAIPQRLRRHKHLLRKGKHFSQHLQYAWDKYGESTFAFFVLEYVEISSTLTSREQFWVDLLAANNPSSGYNVRLVVDSRLGTKMSPEARQKISQANIGRHVSDETRAKIALSNTGKAHSLQTKLKLSAIFKGRKKAPRSEQHRKRLSEVQLGKKLTAEHRRKLSDSHKGYKHTDAQRAKIAAALRGKRKSPETIQRMREAQRARFMAAEVGAAISVSNRK